MSKHDHPEPKPPCLHAALKFCAKCDAVECLHCSKEWKAAADGFRWLGLQRQDEKDERPWYLKPQGPYKPKPKDWLSGEVLCNHVLDAVGHEGGKVSVR